MMNTIESLETLGRMLEIREEMKQKKETFDDLSRKVWIDLTVSIGSFPVVAASLIEQHIPLLLTSTGVSALGLTFAIRNFRHEEKILEEQTRLLLRLDALMPKMEEEE